MHPLVRDLYKRVLIVGQEYPHGIDYVKTKWKEALRNPQNTPSITKDLHWTNYTTAQERELRKAVGKGRYMVREMEAFIQFKKYRAMKKRYG